jgi:ABC-type Na+ transport system ATPase subunit NatA
MKSIVGALKIKEGEIIFDGKNITENETEVKKNIGFLPENNPLYLEMYVKEYLQFVADIHQISKEKVDEIITKNSGINDIIKLEEIFIEEMIKLGLDEGELREVFKGLYLISYYKYMSHQS